MKIIPAYPPYSTDVKYAMEIVMKLNKEGWHFELSCFSPLSNADACFVKNGILAKGSSNTVAHAICLAAMETIKVNK